MLITCWSIEIQLFDIILFLHNCRRFDSRRLHQPSLERATAGYWHHTQYSLKSTFIDSAIQTLIISSHFHEKMKYVYLIRSIKYPSQKYIGITSNIKSRLKAHNEGKSSHTTKFKPWELITYIAFSDPNQAKEFENSLKSGSGRSFASKRLW